MTALGEERSIAPARARPNPRGPKRAPGNRPPWRTSAPSPSLSSLFLSRRALLQVCAGFLDPPVFTPSKLTVTHLPGSSPAGPHPPAGPRRYTLTHNDVTGDLALSVGRAYNPAQLDGWYVRMVRDEVLAEWRFHGEVGESAGADADADVDAGAPPGPAANVAAAAAAAAAGAAGETHSLHVYCHVSGQATWLASPGLRAFIFRREMPLVLDAIASADSALLGAFPALATARVFIHLAASQPSLATTLDYGRLHERSGARPAWPAWEPWAGLLDAARGVVRGGSASGGAREEAAEETKEAEPAPKETASPDRAPAVGSSEPSANDAPSSASSLATPAAPPRGAVVAAAAGRDQGSGNKRA